MPSWLIALVSGRRGAATTGRGRFAGAVAGIDDDPGLFPRGDEGAAGGGAIELHDEVVEGFDPVHQAGHAG